MTVITPENLLAQLNRAADAVTAITAKLTDPDIKAPSELPGLEPRPRPGPHRRHLQRHGPATGIRGPRREH